MSVDCRVKSAAASNAPSAYLTRIIPEPPVPDGVPPPEPPPVFASALDDAFVSAPSLPADPPPALAVPAPEFPL